MDGDKIKDDFEKFLSEHPEAIFKKNGRKLFISSELSTFCFEYNYPLEHARKELKKLGLIGKGVFVSWDPSIGDNRSFYDLEEHSIPEDEIVDEVKEIIKNGPKIVWLGRVWIRKKQIFHLCEKYGLRYAQLLMILRKHRLVGKCKMVYDQESDSLIKSVEVIWDSWENHVVDKVRNLLKDKVFDGRFIVQEDLLHFANRMCLRYDVLVNLLRKHEIIGECMVVFRVKEGVKCLA